MAKAAKQALENAATLAASCRLRGGPIGAGKVRVVYARDGQVQSVELLTARFRETPTGSCISMMFQRAKIAPFDVESPTFIKAFAIPQS